MRKELAAKAERESPQHAVGGIARVFFLPIFIQQIKLFFVLLCLDQWMQHDQTNIFFLSGNTPRDAFCPIFVLKNAPGAFVGNFKEKSECT